MSLKRTTKAERDNLLNHYECQSSFEALLITRLIKHIEFFDTQISDLCKKCPTCNGAGFLTTFTAVGEGTPYDSYITDSKQVPCDNKLCQAIRSLVNKELKYSSKKGFFHE